MIRCRVVTVHVAIAFLVQLQRAGKLIIPWGPLLKYTLKFSRDPQEWAVSQLLAKSRFDAPGDTSPWSTDMLDAEFCNEAMSHAVGSNPGTAYDTDAHCTWSLSTLNVSSLPNYPPPNPAWLEIFHAATPNRQRCNCALEFWHEYAVCRSAFDAASVAMSFGVRGSDPYAEHILRKSSITPSLYDCFVTDEPTFNSSFFPVCVGASAFTDDSGRRFETLSRLLEGAADGSVLMKLDVEGHERDVLRTLVDADFRKLRSLGVEFHTLVESYGPGVLEDLAHAIKHVAQHMVVVEAYYGIVWYRALHEKWFRPRWYHYGIWPFIEPDTIFVNFVNPDSVECRSDP